MLSEHAPHNAMRDPDAVARYYDRASVLMRALLDGLAAGPRAPRPFPEVEADLAWPRRRIAAVLGGAGRMRLQEFGGERPYRFLDARRSPSRRWEIWMDAAQARAVRAAAREERDGL